MGFSTTGRIPSRPAWPGPWCWDQRPASPLWLSAPSGRSTSRHRSHRGWASSLVRRRAPGSRNSMRDELHPPAELIRRLPATFGAALNDQCRQWPLLFPAEQRQLRSQVDWLSGLPRDRFDPLFAPLIALEKRMALPPRDPNTAGLSVRDVGILARSPLYPQWRKEVEAVFGRIDEATAPVAGLHPPPRLVVCILPPGTPAEDQPLWPLLSKDGSWLLLDRPFGETLPAFAGSVAKRVCPAALEEVERTWVFECDTRLSALTAANVLSW